MSYNIDHIVIRADDLEKETESFSRLFGVSPYAPPIDHVFLSNSVFRIGETDIELLKWGEKTNFGPYLFGLSFG